MNPVSALSWQQNFFWLKIKKIWWMWQRVVSQVILATCGPSIVMRTLSINLCRSHFCLTECIFHPVVGSDALARFQKAVTDKANGGPPYCHHNLLLLQFYFLESVLVLYPDEAIEPIIYNCYKRSMTISSRNGSL